MRTVQSAGLILFLRQNNQNLYLLLRYRAEPGHWDFPKGKMELHETKQQAALRELKEETGLDAIIHDNFEKSVQYPFIDHDKQKKVKTVFFFIAHTADRNVILSDEHTDYAWFTYDQALEKITYDNAKNILTLAHAHLNR